MERGKTVWTPIPKDVENTITYPYKFRSDVVIDLGRLYSEAGRFPKEPATWLLSTILDYFGLDSGDVIYVRFSPDAGTEANVDATRLREAVENRDKYLVVELLDGYECALAFVPKK